MKVAAITTSDIANGPGIRCTIWVSGCNHKCPGCHNSELQDYNFGKHTLLSDEVYEKVSKELNKPYISGITLSGGDPLDQPFENLNNLLDFTKVISNQFTNKTIWIYSGGIYEDLIKYDVIKDILLNCDVLVDGLFDINKRDITLPFRGSSNQRIIDLKQTFEKNKVIEINDDEFKQ